MAITPTELSRVAARFAEERHRIGYATAALARSLDTSRMAIMNIERGSAELKSGTLLRAIRMGMDGQYILTGVRSPNLDAVEAAIGYATLGEAIARRMAR